jgi:hypothetical protein
LLARIGKQVPEYAPKAQEIVNTFKLKLIMNKVRKKSQLEDANRFIYLVKEYLSVEMECIGHIEYDDACEKMLESKLWKENAS